MNTFIKISQVSRYLFRNEILNLSEYAEHSLLANPAYVLTNNFKRSALQRQIKKLDSKFARGPAPILTNKEKNEITYWRSVSIKRDAARS